MKKSPFPGMDPYLERHWSDVHHSLIQYTRDVLQPDLPNELISRVEERVYVEAQSERVRAIVPDAHVSEAPAWAGGQASGGTAVAEPPVAVAEPLVFEIDPTTEGFVEIREADGSRVITVIEFLSPANKRAAAELV